MREFEKRPRTLEEVLNIHKLVMEPLDHVPDHLTIRQKPVRDFKIMSKIDVLGITTILFFQDPNEPEKIKAVWFFNGEDTSDAYGSRTDVENKVANSIEVNLAHEKEKNETMVELYSLVLKHRGSVKEIREFPADLDEMNAFYMKRRDFPSSNEDGRTVLRMDFPNGVTILAFSPQDENMYAGIWVHGKYSGGNGDFSIYELESQIESSR